MAGRQLRDSGDGAAVMWDVAVRQVVERGVLVDGGLTLHQGDDRFQLRPEDQPSTVPGVVERLDAEAVPGKQHALAGSSQIAKANIPTRSASRSAPASS